MPNQSETPGPGDVADEKGRFVPVESSGDESIAPDGEGDEAGIDDASGDAPPTPHAGTQDAAIEGLADPGADANFPDPSKPISMR